MKALTDAELAAHSNACRASGVIDEREWWYGALRGTTEALAQERPDEKALITEHDATVELNARRDERAQVTVKLDELRAQRDAAGAAADTNAASLEQCESRARVLLEDNERLKAERDAHWENFCERSGDFKKWRAAEAEVAEARAAAELHRVALVAAQAQVVTLREALKGKHDGHCAETKNGNGLGPCDCGSAAALAATEALAAGAPPNGTEYWPHRCLKAPWRGGHITGAAGETCSLCGQTREESARSLREYLDSWNRTPNAREAAPGPGLMTDSTEGIVDGVPVIFVEPGTKKPGKG